MSALPSMFGMAGPGGPQQQQQPPGPRTDSDFEKSFFDLSFSAIRDKAPTLLPMMLGFQVLDRDEDSNRAAAVFAFKIGKQNVYVPVFFLNGEIKGFELMYVENDDMFRPLDEGWISYILGRRPHLFGSDTDENAASVARSEPDLRVFYDTPMRGAKLATRVDRQLVSDQVLRGLRRSSDPFDTSLHPKTMLSSFPILHAKKAAGLLQGWMRQEPMLGEVLIRHWPECEKALDKFSAVELDPLDTMPVRPTKQSLAIIDRMDDPRVTFLSDDEKTLMAAGEPVIIDTRVKTSAAYEITSPKKFVNPSGLCICEVLVKGGKLLKMLVCVNPRMIGRGRTRFTMLYDLASQGITTVHTNDVWIKEDGGGDWEKFFDNEASNISSLSKGDTGFLVTRSRQATIPFTVLSRLDRSNGDTELAVCVVKNVLASSRSRATRTGIPGDLKSERSFQVAEYHPDRVDELGNGYGPPAFSYEQSDDTDLKRLTGDPQWISSNGRIVITDTGADPMQFTVLGDATIVPKDCKWVKAVKFLPTDSDPGTLLDLEMMLKDDGVKVAIQQDRSGQIKIFHDRDDFRITSLLGTTPPLSIKDAVFRLAHNYGLHGALSYQLVKKAMKDGQTRAWIKFADGYPRADKVAAGMRMSDAFGAANIPEQEISYDGSLGVPVTSDEHHRVPIPMYSQPDQTGAMMGMNDPTGMMMSAAGTGSPSVLDASLMTNLLNSMNADDLTSKYVGDCELAVDRLGRLLFMLYWHFDQFKDRYGSGDLPDLESALKNVFHGLGELVLNLKQKAIQSVSDMRAADLEHSS